MTVERLKALVQDDFDAVNALIFEKMQSNISLIDDLTRHIVGSGGKRLRPLLVLLASRACGYQDQQHIQLATLIEFFHTATLLHDDVIDDSTLRRGHETANTIWGSKASILVGDHLLTQYMQLLIDIGSMPIMQLLTQIAYKIGCGEIKQLLNRHHLISMEEYYDVIQSKTSLLFAASASVGAVISNAPKEIEQSLYQYGIHLGNAFQLVDDALDYCSDASVIGKNIGDDLAEGKLTLPLLYVLKHGTSQQQQHITTSIMQGNLSDLSNILNALEQTKAIEYTYEVAAKEIEQAISALAILADSAYKNALIDLARYATERDH